MSEGIGWSTAGKQAWQWIRGFVSEGLNATQALRQYREAGQSIRDSTWYSLYKSAFSLEGIKEQIGDIPSSYYVPETMATETGYDYAEQYIMNIKLRGQSQDTGEFYDRWVTVESDKLLTKKEWKDLAVMAINETPWSDPLRVTQFQEYEFMKRIGGED